MRVIRANTLTASTALLLLLFVLIVGYAGILAPRRPLFGWVRVVPLDFDKTTGGPVPGEDNIFLLETSCALGEPQAPVEHRAESGLVLPPRTACALEAAAAAHPSHWVYLVHTCPVDVEDTWRGAAPEHALAALSLPNVFLWPVSFEQLLRHTPLQPLLDSGAVARSRWPLAYASHVLRFFLLWKYGGTYLDSDVFVLRPLSRRSDFACAESPEEVSGSALDFSWGPAGRQMAVRCLNETLRLREDAAGEAAAERPRGGDAIVTSAMRALCEQRKVSEMTPERCHGFHILPTPAVYPVAAEDWYRIFSEENAEDTMTAINGSSAIHMWNHLSASAKVDPTSQQPYAQIARHVCPNVVTVIDDYF